MQWKEDTTLQDRTDNGIAVKTAFYWYIGMNPMNLMTK